MALIARTGHEGATEIELSLLILFYFDVDRPVSSLGVSRHSIERLSVSRHTNVDVLVPTALGVRPASPTR
jgi:hypothetical protein